MIYILYAGAKSAGENTLEGDILMINYFNDIIAGWTLVSIIQKLSGFVVCNLISAAVPQHVCAHLIWLLLFKSTTLSPYNLYCMVWETAGGS